MSHPIRASLERVLEGELRPFEVSPGLCMRVVREVIEAAYGWGPGEFYSRYRTHPVLDNPDPERLVWARDIMRSLREKKLRVAFSETEPLILSELRPGDLVFSWALGSPQGHVAVVFSGGPHALVLENTKSSRGVSVSRTGFNRLSRVDELILHMPGSWEAFRLPEEIA